MAARPLSGWVRERKGGHASPTPTTNHWAQAIWIYFACWPSAIFIQERNLLLCKPGFKPLRQRTSEDPACWETLKSGQVCSAERLRKQSQRTHGGGYDRCGDPGETPLTDWKDRLTKGVGSQSLGVGSAHGPHQKQVVEGPRRRLRLGLPGFGPALELTSSPVRHSSNPEERGSRSPCRTSIPTRTLFWHLRQGGAADSAGGPGLMVKLPAPFHGGG